MSRVPQSYNTSARLKILVEDKCLDLPYPLKDADILVYYKRKRSRKFDETDYYIWERDFRDKMVTHEYIHKHQSELVMDLDFSQFAELIDIKPDRGSHFIHSMSEPFSEDDIEDLVMRNWLDHFKINFHQLHASGHMNSQEIMELIEHINPKKVFPLHTEDQQYFKEKCDRVHMIECRKGYTL